MGHPRRRSRTGRFGRGVGVDALGGRARGLVVFPARSALGIPAQAPRKDVREEDLPAQHPASGPSSRVPSPHVHEGRPSHSPCPASARPGPAIGLIHRVRDRASFAALQRRGRRLVTGPVTVVHLEDTVEPRQIKGMQVDSPPRVGFAVPRAVGPAVLRNRARRRLRGVLTERAAANQLPAGSWLFIVRPPAGSWTSAQFAEVVDTAVARCTRGVGTASGRGVRT